MADTSQRKLNPIIQAAIAEGQKPYRHALACEIERDPAGADTHWGDFMRILGRAMILATLEGEAATTQRAKTLGAEFEFEPIPPEDGPERFARVELGDDGEGFISAPFIKAIEAFTARVPRLASQIRPLIERARMLSAAIVVAERAEAIEDLRKKSIAIDQALSRAFWASDVDEGTVVNLHDLLADSLRGTADVGGLGLPDFIDQAQLRGASNLTDARLAVIYRNNVNRSFTDGQNTILRDEVVQSVIPLLELDPIKDNRTRETHKAMNSFIGTQGDFDRQGINPPNGHNCRCSKREMTRSEAIKRGFMDSDGVLNRAAIDAHNGQRQALIDSGEYPDPGWVSSAA